MAAEVEAGASEIELADLREEMSMTRYVTDPIEEQEYREAWRVSGVTCIFQNAGEESQDPLVLMKRLARFTYASDILRGFVSKAAVPEDIEEAKRQGRHCLYLTGNGVPLTQQWVSVPDELRYLRVFYQLGIRMMHLTYQRRNMIGDGCGEKSDAGLSDFGRAAIAEMNRVGVIPDCAHSGWRTSLESARASEKPVVASHTTCAALDARPNARSKPDNVINAIADSEGYVGVYCIPRFLRGTGDLGMFLNHIDHVVKKFGIDHVAIGTDIAYSSQTVLPKTGRCLVCGADASSFARCGRRTISRPRPKWTIASPGPTGRFIPLAWCSATIQTTMFAKSLAATCCASHASPCASLSCQLKRDHHDTTVLTARLSASIAVRPDTSQFPAVSWGFLELRHSPTFSNRRKYDSLSRSFFSSTCLKPASTISFAKTSWPARTWPMTHSLLLPGIR